MGKKKIDPAVSEHMKKLGKKGGDANYAANGSAGMRAAALRRHKKTH